MHHSSEYTNFISNADCIAVEVDTNIRNLWKTMEAEQLPTIYNLKAINIDATIHRNCAPSICMSYIFTLQA